MEKKISPDQLLSSMFLLPYGSAIVHFLASDAKQDAWFSILFYIVPAIVLQLVYIKLYEFYPEDTLTTYLPKVFGKYIGGFISIIYILYFLYIPVRVLRDFSVLIVFSTMSQTPGLFVAGLIMLTVIYGVIVGIETLCRASEILFPLMVFGLLIAILLLVITRNILRLDRLLPVFENGILFPIIKGWYLITFPYGELITFTMIYKNVNRPHKIKKYSIIAIIVEGIILAILSSLYIAALGPNFASTSTFPLLETLRLIKIGGFLERLDILIIITMVIAGFMKISFFMYFGTLGITEVFKIKNRKFLCLIIGVLIWFSSEIVAKNYPQHLKIGLDFTPKYIHLPLQIAIPVITLVIAWFKNKNKNKNSQTTK
jgi:spore germination protein KB